MSASALGRLSRRQVVCGAAALALTGRPAAALARPRRRALPGLPATPAGRVDPAVLQALARRAVEAATAAGAQYADVRLTRTVQQFIFENPHSLPYIYGVYDDEFLGVGVRCLVGGAWGFASSPVWTPDEMVALARTAAGQARAAAAASARRGIPPVEWTPVPVVQGDWSTPHVLDPFTVPIEERADFALSTRMYYARLQGWLGASIGDACPLLEEDFLNGTTSWRQEQALATSEGSYVTQTLYRLPQPDWRSTANGPHPGLPIPAVSSGWEAHQHDHALLRELIPQAYEEKRLLAALPTKPVELGKYDVVLDGLPTAALVSATLAQATQLDRALGYEANAGGATYVGPDPLAQLGRLRMGSPLLTLRTAPTLPHGAATWQWDAEGVVPAATTLIQDGVLVDFQTTREQAAWLAPYYEKVKQPVRSRGCAAAPSALELPLQHPPNLVLAPGQPGTPGQEMIKSIKRGLYIFRGLGAAMDRSVGAGTLTPPSDASFLNGGMREIVNGKLGAKLTGGVLWFRTPELWQHLVAVGPAAEAQRLDVESTKGEPAQAVGYTVVAVPTQFTGVIVTR